MRKFVATTLLRALAIALVLGWAPVLHAQDAERDAAWRKLFRRDTGTPAPSDNPLTPEKIELGRQLFSDPRLSGSGTRACASCHQPALSYTDGRKRPAALNGTPLPRNTPALWNLAWSKHYFWDGRAASLEEQVAMPIENADEMAGAWPAILGRLGGDPIVASQFRTAFPDEDATPSRSQVVRALASFVRALVSPPTRFDDWVDGNDKALDPAELRGFRLFTGKAGCALCHVGWRFTDDRFHDIGLRDADPGRGAVTGTPGFRAFKTPTLRELAHTAPYMHDGALPTLAAVLKHYAGGQVARPSLSTHINRNLRLTEQEKSDVIAFLLTLSSTKKPTLSK